MVYDLQSWRTRAHEFYKGKIIQAKPYGLFHYYVVGRLYSIYVNWRTRRSNLRRAKQRTESSAVPATGELNSKVGLIEAQGDVKRIPNSRDESER